MAEYSGKSTHAALGVLRLGGKIVSDGGSEYSLPTSVRLAADQSFSFGGDTGITLAVDGDYFLSGNYSVAAGARLVIAGMAFLRAGYRYSSDNAVIPTHLALGGGVRLFGSTLDIAYIVSGTTLSGTLAAGLGVRF